MRKTWKIAFWYDKTYIHTVEAFIKALGNDFIETIWHDDYVEIVYAID